MRMTIIPKRFNPLLKKMKSLKVRGIQKIRTKLKSYRRPRSRSVLLSASGVISVGERSLLHRLLLILARKIYLRTPRTMNIDKSTGLLFAEAIKQMRLTKKLDTRNE